MKLNKVLLTGIVGGAVVWVYYFLTHGLILADMYMKHSVFITESANPIWFVFNTVLVALAGALLFAKTRGSWAEGIKGGLTFGFFVGLVLFFYQFFNSFLLEWGGIELIGWLVFGLVAGILYKK